MGRRHATKGYPLAVHEEIAARVGFYIKHVGYDHVPVLIPSTAREGSQCVDGWQEYWDGLETKRAPRASEREVNLWRELSRLSIVAHPDYIAMWRLIGAVLGVMG